MKMDWKKEAVASELENLVRRNGNADIYFLAPDAEDVVNEELRGVVIDVLNGYMSKDEGLDAVSSIMEYLVEEESPLESMQKACPLLYGYLTNSGIMSHESSLSDIQKSLYEQIAEKQNAEINTAAAYAKNAIDADPGSIPTGYHKHINDLTKIEKDVLNIAKQAHDIQELLDNGQIHMGNQHVDFSYITKQCADVMQDIKEDFAAANFPEEEESKDRLYYNAYERKENSVNKSNESLSWSR